MAKYKIVVNPKFPSDEEISKHKDFSKILNQQRKKRPKIPLLNAISQLNRLMFILILAMLMIFIIIIYALLIKGNKNQMPTLENSKKTSSFNAADFNQKI